MNAMDPCHIVLVDDHATFRQEVKRLLCKVPGFEVVGEAGTGLELLTFLSSYRRMPLLVILDLSMPGLSGFETLQKIKEGYPEVKVLILSRHKEEAYLQRAISSQAEGYVVKEDAGTELLPAIEKIQQGGQYISTSFSRNRALPEELK